MSRQIEKTMDNRSLKVHIENSSFNPNRGLIETELIRERLYKSILNEVKAWLYSRQEKLPWTELQISHILLRYIFNKKATVSGLTDDPVFISNFSSIARQQLHNDLKSVILNGARDLAELIDEQFRRAAFEINTREIPADAPVTLSVNAKGSTLTYRDRMQRDFSQLALQYGTTHYRAAYALGIRYSYLRLAAHGLARMYKEETGRKADDRKACECFASAFNHYFDRYYSAFPDLETCFGSSGSFFNANWKGEPQDMTYYINPPFDDTLIELCVDRVLDIIERNLVSEARFIFTVPGTWKDFPALQKLKQSSWTTKTKDYPKGQLPFIDYMSNEECRTIYPTDICEITIENTHEDEFY